MSIEQTLERIANALETIAGSKTTVSIAPVVPQRDVIPGQEAGPGADNFVPGQDAVPTATLITTTEQLKEFAQNLVTKAGDKTDVLVDFIRSKVCAKYNAKDPKLAKIPLDKIPEAVEAIKKEAARLKIEV